MHAYSDSLADTEDDLRKTREALEALKRKLAAAGLGGNVFMCVFVCVSYINVCESYIHVCVPVCMYVRKCVCMYESVYTRDFQAARCCWPGR
jgi:hypothetical protein